MRLEYSSETDQAYLYLQDAIGPSESRKQFVVEALDDVTFDLDSKGRIIGIEFPYNARARLPDELLDGSSHP
jgi:uncharacterized protein YuzE